MRTLTSIFLLFISVTIWSPLHAQQTSDEESAILAAVDRLYAAIFARDRSGMLAATVPGSLNFSIADPVTGHPQDMIIHSHTQSVNTLTLPGPEMSGEYRNPIVLVEGNIAVFWADYDFYLDGEFDHCGVDSFQLLKRDGQWLITNMSSTRRYQDCD
ncbi:MAG: hypothetical protein MI746_13800 [Pseudomonadales bacterium]|nr:hypothetical protein [Pseudomonadales bacterium]